MTHRSKRYCADPRDIAAMKRDGIGWGHDLDCGCFEAPLVPRRSLVAEVMKVLRKGV